jgi:hypothetical protein
LKTKEAELCALLDAVFESGERPDFAVIRELAYTSKHASWLITELLKIMWLCSEDPSAFDEAIWRLTNEAQ